MNPLKFTKAGAGGVGAALGYMIGYYLEWPPEMNAAAGVVLAALLPAVAPKNAE